MGNSLKLQSSKCLKCLNYLKKKAILREENQIKNKIDLQDNNGEQSSVNSLNQGIQPIQQNTSKSQQSKDSDESIISSKQTEKSDQKIPNLGQILKNKEENDQLITSDINQTPNIVSPDMKENKQINLMKNSEFRVETSDSQDMEKASNSVHSECLDPPISSREIHSELRSFTTINAEQLKEVSQEALKAYHILKDDTTGFDFSSDTSIYSRTYQTQQKFYVTVFNFEFKMKGTLNSYKEIYENQNNLKIFDDRIEEYEVKMKSENIQLVYLKCKKIEPIVDPRDYLYVKYEEQVSKSEMLYVCKSIEYLGFNQNQNEEGQRLFYIKFDRKKKKTNYLRGEIILSGLNLKQLDSELLLVKVYLEVNVKQKKRPNMTTKAYLSEIRKNIEKMCHF